MHHAGRTALYRLYDDDGVVIYVGIAAVPEVRWQQHAADKPWWDDVVMREIEWLPTRKEAELCEKSEIASRHPRWNTSPGVQSRDATKVRSASRLWQPSPQFKRLIASHGRTVARLAALRDEMEALAVVEMRAGVTRSRMSQLLPFTEAHVKAIADRAGIPLFSWN